jgi:hypothetical protein
MIEMINTLGIDQSRPPLHAVHDIILGQKDFGEESTVLTRDASNHKATFLVITDPIAFRAAC